MKLLEIRLPNGRTILSVGLYLRTLAVWIGTRQLVVTLDHAPTFRPGASARW